MYRRMSHSQDTHDYQMLDCYSFSIPNNMYIKVIRNYSKKVLIKKMRKGINFRLGSYMGTSTPQYPLILRRMNKYLI